MLSLIFITAFVVLNSVYFIISLLKQGGQFKLTFMVCWGALILWFVVASFIIYCLNSGTPYKSEQHKVNLKYIALIFSLWSVAFTVKIVYAALTESDIDQYQMKDAILIILINVISDIIPEISILEIKFIELFRN